MENQMTRYLYGAAVQGIQAFIFSTNELKDIVGASELVDSICKDCFQEFGTKGKKIVSAAGNVKCIFYNEEDCKKAVKFYPKKVMTMAPGITISQAVVKINPGEKYEDAANKLEIRLRAQRNKPCNSMTIGLMGMERAPKTGLPAYMSDHGKLVDFATFQKREYNKKTVLFHKFFDKGVSMDMVPWNFEDITRQNSWIAIIHADGNGLGEVVSCIGKDENLMAFFSKQLEEATSKAATQAYLEMINDKNYICSKDIIPFRPIVLSGDDLTVVCRADLAIDFTKSYLSHFEENTKSFMVELKDEVTMSCLTVCAGIAFIKASYPFYYGYDLAESLCSRAKKDAQREKSCLLFHKVQSCFVEEFEEIIKKELTPSENHSYEFGPYYLKRKAERWTIDELMKNVKELNKEENNSAKTAIRQWLTAMADSPLKAKKKKERVLKVSDKSNKEIFQIATDATNRSGQKVYPAYNLLSLHSIFMRIKKKETNK